MIGNELGLPDPVTADLPGGTITWTPTLAGFALCLPPDPHAAPGVSPPIYGCEPDVVIEIFANPEGTEITLTVSAANVFYDFEGEWNTNLITPNSGTGEGFLIFESVVFTATATLEDAGSGLKTIGAVTQSSFDYDGDLLEIEFGNPLLDSFASLTGVILFTTVTDSIGLVLVDIVEQNALAIPPFELEL